MRTGVVVGVTNPKTFVLFTAVVPQFVDPAAGGTTVQMLVLGVVPMLIGLVTDTTWAIAAGRARTWLASSPRRMTTVGRAGGACIIGWASPSPVQATTADRAQQRRRHLSDTADRAICLTPLIAPSV